MSIGVLLLLIIVPMTSTVTASQTKQAKVSASENITPVICKVGDQTTTTSIPASTIQTLVDMGKAHEKDFLKIYNKTQSDTDVDAAFANLQPFFQALVHAGLTQKTVEDINSLYHTIRDKIREPKRLTLQPKTGPQPAGLWNGVPTPVWMNALCGIFEAGQCAGFVLGTHTVVPTIGADVFMTYMFAGTSVTLGAGGNTAALAGFDVIFGFLGILIVTPIVMVGPYFEAGLCAYMLGVGV